MNCGWFSSAQKKKVSEPLQQGWSGDESLTLAGWHCSSPAIRHVCGPCLLFCEHQNLDPVDQKTSCLYMWLLKILTKPISGMIRLVNIILNNQFIWKSDQSQIPKDAQTTYTAAALKATL